jgi:hypothetical protein
VTFQQLLAKYEKEKADKGSNRSNHFRHTKSFSRRHFDDYKHWQENEYTQMPYFPIEYMYWECPPKMPMSYEPYFACSHYLSYGWYDPWMHVPSYFRPYHLEYAAPKESTFERQSHANDRFKEKTRSGAQVNKKVVKQVYRLKKDGHKDKSSVLDSNNEKPINVLETSATISEKMKQSGTNNLDVKSEQNKLKVPKVKDELLQFTRESQLRCSLGLSQKDMYTQQRYFPMEQTGLSI